MNKIYKVIWSKVRNCYVAVSEIAKRNGKSCTSVNCGAKVKRGHAGVALALALAMSLTGGGVAWAADVSGQNVNITTNQSGNVYGGKVDGTGNAMNNTITVSAGTVNGSVYGAFTSDGNVGGDQQNDGNRVTISGGKVTIGVFGGVTDSGIAKNNSVTISNGEIGGSSNSGISGGTGSGDNGNAIDNQVTITGGTINVVEIFGGVANGKGYVDNNTVTISGGTIQTTNLYGGKINNDNSNGNATNNNVSISGSATIGTTSVSSKIYGGYAKNGAATGNTVDINLVTNDNGTPNNTADDTGVIWGTVYGGYSAQASANSNTVKISGTVSGGVYGGYSNSSSTSSSANENVVTIQGTVTSDVNGGNAYHGNVSGNIVYIKSGASVQKVAGGNAREYGSAETNRVEISGGTVSGEVYGGFSNRGNAGGNTNAKGNTVTISAGSVTNDVYGGDAPNNDGNAMYNTVKITGGAVGGTSKTIYGGYGRNKAQNNTVSITGGSVTGTVYGGYGYNGIATDNTVIISGGTINGTNSLEGGHSTFGNVTNNTVVITGGNFIGKTQSIFAGSTQSSGEISGNTITIAGGSFNSSDSDSNHKFYGGNVTNNITTIPITDNTINLYGSVTGLNKANLYGAKYSNTNTTGNELHIGGVKNNTMLATGTTATPWTGTTGNKVKSVNNFNSIVLHNVNWSPDTDNTTGTPVLAAGSFSNIGLLDVSKMELQGELSLGTMALLQSGAANFNFYDMKLTYKYNGNPATGNYSGAEISTSTSLTGLGTNAVIHTGVKADYDGFAVVEFKPDQTAVNLTIAPEWKSVTLGEMNWADGGYSISTPGRIAGGKLAVTLTDNFKVSGAENQTNGTSIDLLNLSGITGTIKNAVSKSVTVTLADAAVDEKLTLSRERTDTATASAGGKQVVYTTGANDNVIKATFGAGINWNTTTPYYTHPTDSLYKFGSSTGVDAGGLTITFTDAQKAALKKDDSMTLLSATGITSSNTVTPPTNSTVAVSNTSTLGTQFGATATGTVAAETGAVKYKISSVDVNTITLDSLAWGSTDSLPVTWTASENTTVNASGFNYAAEPKATTALAVGDTATILTAQGLSSANGSKISNGTGKTVGIYTDSGNGVKLDATATGHVAAAENALNYVVDGITLNSIVLKDWNGATTDTPPTVPTGWTLKQEGETVVATINTNDVAPAEPIAFGEQRTLLTASDGYFTNMVRVSKQGC